MYNRNVLMTRNDKLGWLVLATTLSLSGCRGHDAPPFPTWAERPVPYAPSENSRNAYDDYVIAARMAEDALGADRTRVTFDAKMMRALSTRAAAAVARAKVGVKKVCAVHYVARAPFEAVPFQLGWRTIGRCLVWDVKRFSKVGDFHSAIRSAIVATKFGFDLTGGAATDASLGLTIVDEARQTIAPYLIKMNGDQLHALSQGIKVALERKPLMYTALNHELDNMQLAVQSLQDAYRDNHLDKFTAGVKDLNETVAQLREMHSHDDSRRVDQFQVLADTAKKETQTQITLAAMSGGERNALLKKDKTVKAMPKFAQYFFTAGRPLLRINDATTARTRLLILECELLRESKQFSQVPKDLSGFTKSIVVDPYSSLPFIYRTEGAEFNIYSVGANGVDDGGTTDDSFSTPDLRLERRN